MGKGQICRIWGFLCTRVVTETKMVQAVTEVDEEQ